jgi:DNA-binding response OmpR family regulator
MLWEHTYKVAVAEDGEAALAFVERRQPDLILLDIAMPGLDGFDVCTRLKENPAHASIPVVFLSVRTETSEKVRAFKCGGVDYIAKPFQREEVVARIEAHLQLQQTKRMLQDANEALEQRVKERTSELMTSNAKLEEANIALRVLLEQKDESRGIMQETMVVNLKQSVLPLLSQLENEGLTSRQLTWMGMIRASIEHILSPTQKSLAQEYGFTSTESRLAELIKQGLSTKEIASMLQLSKRTIDTHRHNMRKKLGLSHTSRNLRACLLDMESVQNKGSSRHCE